ncbi:hypothetical protein FQA47_003849 [Oryzias melastigma]|uniref:Uncharacterized protein n=1 Tax=Oryzias melastigma TaxID=30732 RepID=A0A834FDN5_ORYME|nr:hypothetical protein FQA47_003849 [Oryzias melastigma]
MLFVILSKNKVDVYHDGYHGDVACSQNPLTDFSLLLSMKQLPGTVVGVEVQLAPLLMESKSAVGARSCHAGVRDSSLVAVPRASAPNGIQTERAHLRLRSITVGSGTDCSPSLREGGSGRPNSWTENTCVERPQDESTSFDVSSLQSLGAEASLQFTAL